ncbi:MAG: hypothetical protein A2Z83_08955 [Omnitrophica bacterium GWA2_52_8]|nr:MAG: hypothetical protein A2Z83_08955 [Omnitrophica bacterium GWA2_52_8]
MSKLKLSTREIGNVNVFDLIGEPTQETLQDVAWQIQRKIRRHRMQRVILNLQLLPSIDALGVRKLIAACIRPQKSLIFGASSTISHFLENTYLPRNIHICTTEKEVAEDFGPFLLEKEEERAFPRKDDNPLQQSIGEQLERRRSKRMHVVLPIDIVFTGDGKNPFTAHALATNISEGGLFAEFLDLGISEKIDEMADIVGMKAQIQIYPSANFTEEYRVDGIVRRKELRKKQLGVAIEFIG